MVSSGVGDLYRLQLKLECKEILACGHMAEFPCANPDGLAMVSIVRPLDGASGAIRAREDVAAHLDPVLAEYSPDQLLQVSEGTTLGGYRVTGSWSGRTGVFRRRPQPPEYAEVTRHQDGWVIRRDGRVAAWAVSSRENDLAAELGCGTEPGYRRQGLGRQVCSAWAAAVLDSGKTPFYSHDIDNHASAALAGSLGVEFVFEAAALDLGGL